MKSLVEEASSVIKAIEKAWNRAGNPETFSVKIFETPEKNFFGFTKKSAKIGIFFSEEPTPIKRQSGQGRNDYNNQRRNDDQTQHPPQGRDRRSGQQRPHGHNRTSSSRMLPQDQGKRESFHDETQNEQRVQNRNGHDHSNNRNNGNNRNNRQRGDARRGNDRREKRENNQQQNINERKQQTFHEMPQQQESTPIIQQQPHETISQPITPSTQKKILKVSGRRYSAPTKQEVDATTEK